MSSYGEVPKGYYMDESNPELLVLRRKKGGLRLAFFPPERATRIACSKPSLRIGSGRRSNAPI